MAKGAYIGVDGVARKIKKGYIGVDTEVPIYEVSDTEVQVTGSNIATYFDVENGTNAFSASGTTFVSVKGSSLSTKTSETKWTAKCEIHELSINYTAGSKGTLTISINSTQIANLANGESGSWSGALSIGDKIVLTAAEKASSPCSTISEIFLLEKIQIGTEVRSIARKIRRAYIGIGGVARPCWNGGELAYYGAITDLNAGRRELAAATIGNYALFAGGIGNTSSAVVDAYDKSLVRTTPTALSKGRYRLAAATVGNYALFAGGSSTTNVVDAYDTALTRTTPTAIDNATTAMAGVSIGNYALFGGGEVSAGATNWTYAYDTSLTKTLPNGLITGRRYLSATRVGNYAIFAGGEISDGTKQNFTDAYDSSLTRTTPTYLSTRRSRFAATAVGNYALFGGGHTSSGYTDTVEVYDDSLTHSVGTSLSASRGQLAATSVEGYALFGGGGTSDSPLVTVDAYDEQLTRFTTTELITARYTHTATTIGNYALFAGGMPGNTATVEAYVVA